MVRTLKHRRNETEQAQGIRQIPFRIHAHEKTAFQVLLRGDRLTFQEFVDLCVQAYMRGSKEMIDLLREQKSLAAMPKEISERYTLSRRERAGLLDAIDERSGQDPVPEQRDRI